MFNKKGQELSITTLILIIIGVVVLVLVILGFTAGFGNLRDRLDIFVGGTTIDSVIGSCEISSATNAKFSYCADFKKVRIGSSTEYISCEDTRVSGIDAPLDCSDSSTKTNINNACNDLAKSLKATVENPLKINGESITGEAACNDPNSKFAPPTS